MEKKYRIHLMICAGTSCVSSGSLDVRDALVEEVEKTISRTKSLLPQPVATAFARQAL